MDEQAEKSSPENDDSKLENGEKKNEDLTFDPEIFSCMLQPSPADSDSDPNYIGIRRLLLYRKAQSGVLRRKDWRCNGKGYVAFRNYINRPRNWDGLQTPSYPSTPGQSERWIPSTSPISHLFEVDSWGTSRVCVISPLRLLFYPSFRLIMITITVIKFGHMSSDLLAYGASDGSLTVCTVSTSPAVLKQLTGHTKDVTDFDFSTNNQYITSSSIDKTVRVWDISKGLCMRVIYGVSPELCIRFHPVNNNFLSVGNANKEIMVFNFSTGRTISKATFDSEVTAMDQDHTGQIIFCGDAKGYVYTVSMDSRTGALSRSHRNKSRSKQNSPVTTVQYRTFSLLARGPVLLTFSQDGSLSFFSVSLEVQGYLTVRCTLKLAPRLHSIRASFCPLLSLEKGEFIVAGSEDANVYFYDLTRPKHTCVNKLQGHGYPVIGIAWNHGENLLASSDFGGTVIVWKRAKTS
ncbi:WD repeat-containing 13 [Olea europaea subsp. europaea]|uniref:WD repeat-containing 13 n=1 Tax=Olea europaea subsp. europaea TaxID=158383 RepID=A0A8S0UGE8_OLEEU|nr:WD repeat-containing 13 [Olea europaea subsp. europaea]